ncbi:MAG: sodium:proton antiporter [Geobacter sp.]|nr:MAG: sodium:proton antiporter [Geobacter sp.]
MKKMVAIFIVTLLAMTLFMPFVAGASGTEASVSHAAESAAAIDHPATPAVTDHAATPVAHGEHGNGHTNLGAELPLWAAIPFAGILLSIALFPLFAPNFWHHHYPKVSLAWALLFAVPFLFVYKGTAFYEICHIYIIDYIPFIILLGGLFTVSGGILVRGTLKGSPAVNCLILIIGTILASWIGTTGAAMVLIRPLLRSVAWRKHKVHTIVFFIFLVCNVGGALTPLGDPPLFLGFLHGVPFFWTLKAIPAMLFVSIILLIIYFAMDSFYYRKEDLSVINATEKEPLKIEGMHNFLYLGGIIGAVLFSGLVKMGNITILGVHQALQNLVKDAAIVLIAVMSMVTTSKTLREDNQFSWEPIKEVAYLFAGIFMTIIPALAILKAGEQGALGLLVKAADKPAHYFWLSGILSSFLDNAPTYLSYFNTALGKFFPGQTELAAVPQLCSNLPIPGRDGVTYSDYLLAISLGSVFMGANTYIGNAPNFMVKSIAEESGVAMPSFFGYMFKYSIPFLVVTFILVTFVFF